MSRLLAYLDEALASIWRNRTRSILTMLGMIIGSASIIAVFGISRAAATGISSTFSSFGQLPVFVSVDPSQEYPQQAAIQYRDAATVAAALGDRAAAVLPNWQRTYEVSVGNVHDDESVSSDGPYHTDSLVMAEGRKIDASDVDNAARVCVMTSDLARKYFGDEPALGKFMRVKGERCAVLGVYADIKGSFMNSLVGNGIVLPYTTFHEDFAPGDVDLLLIYPSDPTQADAVGNAAIAALQHVHGERAEYKLQNGAGFVGAFDGVLNIVATGLSAIGSVALVVAGIGIMNIMLVSVTERTREIGIRKAIGANRANIVEQFLMEAIVLALAGGGIGMLLGLTVTVGAVSLLSKQIGVMIIPYLLIICIALGFSIGVGVIFGTYPAIRAAKLDPIEALRS
ncbi:MAG TPA: ABC transporter permease [Candidatus Baltobacteraceae bacterium]|nr:ABC transporter permease [Candidatus Baltobacteraceae bacterium]